MLILALDTSGDVCSVALAAGAVCRAEFRFRHERRLSERLPAIVEFLLRDAGTTLRDVDAFAVGLGPGSFTGVRVGVTTAKVWAMALGKPVVGVPSLDALADAAGGAGGVVIAVAPSRRDEAVAAYYRAEGVKFVPHILAYADVAARGAEGSPEPLPIVLAGEIAAAVREATPERLRGRVTARTAAVSSASVARLAARRLERGDYDDPDALAPLYVTPSPVGV